MSMGKQKDRGRPEFEGGMMITIKLTAKIVALMKKKQLENPNVKRAKLIRRALRAQWSPPGQKREKDDDDE